MSLYLFFLGVILFCVLQFVYGNLICLAVFLIPVFWTPLLLEKSLIKYRYVYFAFFIFWLISVWWISSPHPVAILGLVVLSFFLSFYWLLFFISARAAIHLLRVPIIFAVPLCWIGCEFLRNNLLGGFSFCSIEHLLYNFPILIQIADLGGGYFVGGMIMSVGVGVGTILFTTFFNVEIHRSSRVNNAADIVVKNTSDRVNREASDICDLNLKNRNGIFVTIILTFLILAFTIFYGYLTIIVKRNPFDGGLTNSVGGLELNVASLQGNSPVSISMTMRQLQDCLEQYIDLTLKAVRENGGNLDLIIWPETVCPIPYIIFQDGTSFESQNWNRISLERERNMLLQLSTETRSPILYGISTIVVDNIRNKKTGVEPLRLNSALLVLPFPAGEFKARYDKIQLVMFGEYVPFADYLPSNFPLRSICQEAGRGKMPVAIPVKDGVIASVNICFESSVPHHVRGQILSLKRSGQEPVLLINISNSGWFKFAKQIDQHLATHIFRAIENRRPYIAATNGGFSVTINCFGKISKIGKRKSSEPVIDRLKIQYWTPLYHYIGDIPAIFCTIITIFLTLYAYANHLRKRFR